MSGGSHNYLYNADMPEMIGRTEDMAEMEQRLIELGYTDIAKDVRRLIEYCISAQIRIGVLFAMLKGVFHDIEWYDSADIGESTLRERLEDYRAMKENKKDEA